MAFTDLSYTQDIAAGARGARARLVQEWLGLHGVGVVPDGKFGPATASAVRGFQKKQRLPETGVVDRATFDALVAPMAKALKPIAPKRGDTLGSLVVAYAKQHLAQHPREIGGANMGPWVRLYMDGNQGEEWLWCAGFATYVLKQAADTVGAPMPVKRTYSCDVLAGNAKAKQCFCAGPKSRDAVPSTVTPGSLFLNRRSPTDWYHVGIVVGTEPGVIHTIEGNSDHMGSSNGYEVCQQRRGLKNKDFVLIA